MSDRQLIWTAKRCEGNPTKLLPAYYMESEYVPTAVRIRAEDAPCDRDAQFEIYDDGVTIMNDYSYNLATYQSNTLLYSGSYEIRLPVTATIDEMAEDFNANPIEAGSWITCSILDDGGGKNFTVIMELDKLSESDEDTE